jgi:tetratricopeptide (TPR) repeat protein
MMGAMKKCVVAALLVLLCVAVPTAAQNTQSYRGRVFLPNGEPFNQVVAIILSSEDPARPPEYSYTDSKGWFFIQGLRLNHRYTITIESDGETWATTSESFIATPRGMVTIQLLPLQKSAVLGGGPAVSAYQLQFKPRPAARRAYEEAQKLIAGQKFDDARALLRRAIEEDPGYVNAYNELAVIEMRGKRYAEALPLLRAALEKDPEAVHPLMNIGITFTYLERYAEAVDPLRRCMQLRPAWLVPKIYLGVALVETEQLEEAEALLLRGVKAGGREEALSFLYLGKLYAMKGDREKAITNLQGYLDRDPDSRNAVEVRSLLERLRPRPSAQRP